MSIILPKKVRSIISVINEAGFPAHIVGGCVRDLLMGKTPHDWDIATMAEPSRIKEIFIKSRDTGLKHGTVIVDFEGQPFEITTWRRDMTYNDHRHPDRVEFTNSLETDLSRRDFTINAMAYHPAEGLIDPFHGLEDIKNGIIRSVGDPVKRFGEDALRMLRAIRFSAQLGFEIESATYAAIKKLRNDMAYISSERIQAELNKILESANPEKIGLIWDTGLDSVIFPEIPHLPEVCMNACRELKNAPDSRTFILSALYYGAFKADRPNSARNSLRRLKYDNETISGVLNTLRAIEILTVLTARNYRRACRLYGPEAARRAVRIIMMDRGGSKNDFVIPEGEPVAARLTGSDLMDAGLCAGREIGMILSILDLCLFEKPELNERETLMMLAEVIRGKHSSFTESAGSIPLPAGGSGKKT